MNRSSVLPVFGLVCSISIGCANLDDLSRGDRPSSNRATAPARGPGCDDLALAPSLPAQCRGPEMVRITRPVAKDDPNKGQFSYGFRYKAATSSDASVLVFLPGGPGAT